MITCLDMYTNNTVPSVRSRGNRRVEFLNIYARSYRIRRKIGKTLNWQTAKNQLAVNDHGYASNILLYTWAKGYMMINLAVLIKAANPPK